MHTRLLDAFTDLSDWMAVTSGQARLDITTEPGPHGQALRLDFDFGGSGGFVVARKPFAFALPETFEFRFAVRAAAPPNSFEFSCPAAQAMPLHPKLPSCFGPLQRGARPHTARVEAPAHHGHQA